MTDVGVVILHPEPPPTAGPLTLAVAAARATLAGVHRAGFLRAGATTARIVAGRSDERSFGARLREIALDSPAGGLVVLGSGAVPLLTAADRRRFVATAAADRPVALANNAYSADIVAIANARDVLATLPDLGTDNALPRWLTETTGVEVADLRHRWRLGVDIDGPLDLVLLGGRWRAAVPPADRDRVEGRLGAVRAVVTDARAEVVVTGRTSQDALAWLARAGAARTRALVEERGLRTSVAAQRPPASVLGMLLDRDGPASVGEHLARLGEAAIVDTRVLLAHRLGPDERAWPIPEDRFASDLLMHERVADPWLRELTCAAAEAPIPVVLGGHTLVGPGLRLALQTGASVVSDPRVGLRRDPPTDLSDVGEDAGLVARIRDEIRRGGPMSFARFMELALYDPDGGYYRAEAARPGREGDFLTAPELHPIFGATLATGLREIWVRLGRPDPFVVREHGAGTGALGLSVLGAVDDPTLRAAIRYQSVEVDPRRITAFTERLTSAGFGDVVEGPADDEPFQGVVFANEVLDALPVHRVRQGGATLREIAVEIDAGGAFADVEIDPTTPALAARLAAEGIDLADGQTAEICLALDAWVAAAAASLTRGLLLLIDYGASAAKLYDPVRRRDGTLLAYVRHQVHDDPYRFVGRQDLTAHVDVTAVERAAEAAGLTTVGITTQAEALMGLGIQDRLQAIQADPATTMEAYTLLRSSLMRLLDPAAMGRFRVMAFGRGWPTDAETPLGMFSFRLPRKS